MPHMTREWNFWHKVTASDTVPSDLKPSGLASPRYKLAGTVGLISVRHWDKIMLQVWGKNTENDTFSLACVGWMDQGPGQIVLRVPNTAKLGAHKFTEELLPKSGLPSAEWFEADFDGGSIADASTGATISTPTAAPAGTHILIPTFGFTFFQLFMVLDGSSAATELAALWRPTISNRM